jgi:GTPase SAR1 family protein
LRNFPARIRKTTDSIMCRSVKKRKIEIVAGENMTEKHFINKAFYETFMVDQEGKHPVAVLGEAYFHETELDSENLSHIRYAQGEVYYHFKDYEAAIYKWEKVKGTFVAWAQKNMADAYFQLGNTTKAEELYKSVQTDSDSLTSEIALQLFSLYLEQERKEHAFRVIKEAVVQNPDYPNVTSLARTFYEEEQDWSSAIELAVNEIIRTKSTAWMQVLIGYIQKGFTKDTEPDYFSEVLRAVYEADIPRFREMVSAHWNSYRQSSYDLKWLQAINNLFDGIGYAETAWEEISDLYRSTYKRLISGSYFITEFEHLVPNLLANWLKIANQTDALFAAAAVLAWEGLFPSTIERNTLQHAEHVLYDYKEQNPGLEEGLHLLDTVLAWAEQNEFPLDVRVRWMMEKLLHADNSHVLVTGINGSGKSYFINSILGEQVLGANSPGTIIIEDAPQVSVQIVSQEGQSEMSVEEFYEITAHGNEQDVAFTFQLPSPFLQKYELSFIDTPEFANQPIENNRLFRYLHYGDSLLFVLNAHEPFTAREQEIVLTLQEQAPNLPIHFVLNKLDGMRREDIVRLLEDVQMRVQPYFPNARVFAAHANEIGTYMQALARSVRPAERRTSQVLSAVRNVLIDVMEQRIAAENSLMESIHWNEDMLVKLNGFINNLTALEAEKYKVIASSYRDIKENIAVDMRRDIPVLLQGATSLIHDEQDFRNIHVTLNEQMNDMIQDYVTEKILPKLTVALRNWLDEVKEELSQSQTYLYETSEAFNTLYEEEKMQLTGDFKILEDWRRDTERMLRRIRIADINILLRFTPGQFLLKSAGKLLGGFSQNKQLLENQYRKYIENEDYTEVTQEVIRMCFEQFTLFERALEEDVSMFFAEPFRILKETVEETHMEIQQQRDKHSAMKANPEVFQDPLKLFHLRLRQQEVIRNMRYVAQMPEVEPIG